jgi:hypothetical protein
MSKTNVYQCPVCFFHRQKFGAKSRLALQKHLEFSHLQRDLVRYIVKQTLRVRD